MKHSFNNIVLSSGSFYTSTYIGCLKYLEEVDILKNIKTFIGSSGGSIICFLHVIGFDPDHMGEFIKTVFERYDLNVDINLSNFINLTEEFGLDDSSNMKCILEEALELKGFEKNATIIDVVKKTGKNIVFCTTNVTKGKSEYMSIDTYPELEIVKAVQMSCAIPLIYQPIKFNDCYYLDGAVTDAFPFKQCEFEQINSKDTLCICIKFTNPTLDVTEDTTSFDFFSHVLILYIQSQHKSPSKKDGYKYIEIVVNTKSKKKSCFSLKKISSDDLDKYITLGYKTIKSSL